MGMPCHHGHACYYGVVAGSAYTLAMLVLDNRVPAKDVCVDV
jgi:hypothetical protein